MTDTNEAVKTDSTPIVHRKKVYVVHNQNKKSAIPKKPEKKKLPAPSKLVHSKLSYLKGVLEGFKKEDSNFSLPKDARLHTFIQNNILPHGLHVQDDFVNGTLFAFGVSLKGNPHNWKREEHLGNFKENFQPHLKVVKIDIGHTQKSFRGDFWFRVKDKVHIARLPALVDTYLDKVREDLKDNEHFLLFVPPHYSIDESIQGIREILQKMSVTVKDGKTFLNDQDKVLMRKMGGIKFLHDLHKNT